MISDSGFQRSVAKSENERPILTFSAAAGAVVAWVPAGAAAGAAQAATAAMIITSTATIMSSMGDCLSHFYLQNRLTNCASKDAGGLVVRRAVGESGETGLGMANQCLVVRVQRIVGIRRRIWGSPPVCISVDSLRFSNYTMKVYSVALELSKQAPGRPAGTAMDENIDKSRIGTTRPELFAAFSKQQPPRYLPPSASPFVVRHWEPSGGIRCDIPLPHAQIALQRRKEPLFEIQPRKRRSKQRLRPPRHVVAAIPVQQAASRRSQNLHRTPAAQWM